MRGRLQRFRTVTQPSGKLLSHALKFTEGGGVRLTVERGHDR